MGLRPGGDGTEGQGAGAGGREVPQTCSHAVTCALAARSSPFWEELLPGMDALPTAHALPRTSVQLPLPERPRKFLILCMVSQTPPYAFVQ